MFNIDDCNQEMDLSIEAFKSDLKNIRTGRVSPDILKTVIIDSYGSKMPLTQLSNINNVDNPVAAQDAATKAEINFRNL